MDERLRHPLAVLALQVLSFWPVWGWYAARVRDGSDEPWCVLALLTAAVFLLTGSESTRRLDSLVLPIVFAALYIAASLWLPPIFGAAIAFLAVGSTLAARKHDRFFLPGVWGLLVLSVPLLASLQFCFGYPLRILVGQAVVRLLSLGGVPVAAEGTALNWAGRLIEIDAPCSGIRMLWVGFYLTFTLAAAYRLNPTRTAVAAAATLLCVIAGNVLRAASLFYVESHIIELPEWSHAAVGITAFAMLAVLILQLLEKLRRRTV